MPMAKKIPDTATSFGQRLASLRRARGLSQRAFGARLGISGRVVAYYEIQTDRPPAHLLPKICQVLEVAPEQLLGFTPVSTEPLRLSTKLWRRMREIDALPPDVQKAMLKILDQLIAKEKMVRGTAKPAKRTPKK